MKPETSRNPIKSSHTRPKNDTGSLIIAVASGKGGVGKTLTSVNLALFSARNGLRTALVDADPLANTMTLLDYPIPPEELPKKLKDPESQAFRVAPLMEVIFPQTKTDSKHTAILVKSLLDTHHTWLTGRYSIIIVDMPAGTGHDNSFPYLNLTDIIVLVVNPEPTSHVAAGSFLKNTQHIRAHKHPFIWHNRYEQSLNEDFDPNDIIGNYNRNVTTEESLPPLELQSIAYIPSDPSLDLVRSEPDILVDLHRSLNETLMAISDTYLPPLPQWNTANPLHRSLLTYYIHHTNPEDNPDNLVREAQNFISSQTETSPSKTLTSQDKKLLHTWALTATTSRERKQIRTIHQLITTHIGDLESATPPLHSSKGTTSSLDREIVSLLKTLNTSTTHTARRRLSALLLYRFTLIKLFSHPQATTILNNFIPRRNENGKTVRNRRKQIIHLAAIDQDYRRNYLKLVKQLYPQSTRQRDHLVTTFKLNNLIFRNADGTIANTTYIKLFSATLYELINSGLGIVAGFRFRPSSRAFMKGYEELIGKHVINKP